jgi:hypothetical protein
MRLTKDEARILAVALESDKYSISRLVHDEIDGERGSLKMMEKLNQLEEKLLDSGKDKRRIGRTSMDDFPDCLKRYAKS